MEESWQEGNPLIAGKKKKGGKAEGQLGNDLNNDGAPVDKWL